LIASTLTLAPSIWGTRDKKSSSSPFAMFVRASLAKASGSPALRRIKSACAATSAIAFRPMMKPECLTGGAEPDPAERGENKARNSIGGCIRQWLLQILDAKDLFAAHDRQPPQHRPALADASCCNPPRACDLRRANSVGSYQCAYSAPTHLCQHPRMAPTKRKTSRKSVSTTKPVKKKRTANKRGTGGRRKSLVADVVHSLEQTLEAIPKKIRKAAKKTKTAASRNRVVAGVVHKLESVPKKVRKAAKKKGWRV
jgi:uncharacterized protein (UPF0147 family)